jgi:hypothetical protein
MNLKQLKRAFDISDGDMYFVADDPTKQAIKKKLTTPPLQGVLDITIKKRADGVEIVYLPKSKKNIYAFEHLLVIDPKEDAEVIREEPKVEPKEEPKVELKAEPKSVTTPPKTEIKNQ